MSSIAPHLSDGVSNARAVFFPPEAAAAPELRTAIPSFIERVGVLRLSLLGAWLFVAAALVCCMARRNLRARTRFMGWRQVADPRVISIFEDCRWRAGINFPVGLLSAEDGGSPLLCGWLRPAIVIPANVLSSLSYEELRLVFLHELAHIKRNDVAVNWLAAIFQILHWFNPFVWLAFKIFRADREQACDALAIRIAGGVGKNVLYGEAMIKTLKLINRIPLTPLAPDVVGIAEDKEQMKNRMLQIGSFGRTARFSAIVSVGVVAALTLFVMTGLGAGDSQAVVSVQGHVVNAAPGKAGEALLAKLKDIKLAHIEFSDASLPKTVELLTDLARKAKNGDKDISIILDPADPGLLKGGATITMSVDDIALYDVLNFTTRSSQLDWWIADGKVVIGKKAPVAKVN